MANKMDEFKQKLMGLITKQPPKIPSMGFDDSNYHFSQMPTLCINSKTAQDRDRPADQDILESIEAAYFAPSESFDICRFELMKLPEVLDCHKIEEDFKNLKQQHSVVSKKVLQLILEHQSACNEEFKSIQEILEQVKETFSQCKESRRQLAICNKQVSSSLGILANYRKRKLAQRLLSNLNMIKNLYSFNERCQTLLSEEDYAGAITELKRCQKTAIKYRHFSCVAALTYKLQETLESTDAKFDRILSEMCYHFDSQRYSKLQLAYDLLEKSQLAMIDNIHVHYITAIYNSSFNIVNSFVDSMDVLESGENSGRNPYKVLCQSVPQECFIPCLVQLCKVLFKIVLSYHQLSKWYCDKQEEQSNSDLDVELNMSKQKLEHNVIKIWDDVQRKVSSLLLNVDLAAYKFDQFVQVLRIVHRLMQVGEEFCSSKSEDLQESIRKQSVYYFKSYHAQRMEELKIFMENETWEICPVKSSFSILQLQEFKSVRSVLKNFKNTPQASPTAGIYSANSTECSSCHSQDGSSVTGTYFVRHAHHGTPFDASLDETIIEEDILTVDNGGSGYFSDDSEDEESEELKKEFVDEEQTTKNPQEFKAAQHHQNCHILTNTTLSVLRQMGKYLQMSRLLKPISFQIISCMNQLFDYYLYCVHLFFASDLTVSSNNLYSEELAITFRKINDNLIFEHPVLEQDFAIPEGRICKPSISPMVDLKTPEKLHGLAERIVAVESLVFLSRQYEFLQEYLEHLVSQPNKVVLQQFFSQVATTDNLVFGGFESLGEEINAQVAASLAPLENLGSRINQQVQEGLKPLRNLDGLGESINRQVQEGLEPVRALELKLKMQNGVGGVTIATYKPDGKQFIIKNSKTYTCNGTINLTTGACSELLPFKVTASSPKTDWCYVNNFASVNDKLCLSAGSLSNVVGAPHLRRPVYMAVIAQAFDLRQILISMSKINWEVKEVMSQHNSYIDLILREVQIFRLRLDEVSHKVSISGDVQYVLWESIAHIVTHTLVQGFSEAKKCSNAGRALMQLDFTQFLMKFEKISTLKPVPHKEYVENYVKAFYLPEQELENFIREHAEYSSKHLFGLVSCACQNNKKARQRLLQVIEELEKAAFGR